MKLKRPLAVIDVETTGKDVSKDRICQISITKLFPEGDPESKTRLINPVIEISPEATETHGLTNEQLVNEPTFAQLSSGIMAFISDSDLCGYNLVSFDLPILIREFNRCGLGFPVLPDLKIVDPYIIECELYPRKLSAIYNKYTGKELKDAHSADADVQATLEILNKQIELHDLDPELEKLNEMCGLHDIVDWDRRIKRNEKGEYVFAFGKWEGQKITDHKDYAEWMLSTDFLIDTKNWIKKILNI